MEEPLGEPGDYYELPLKCFRNDSMVFRFMMHFIDCSCLGMST